MKTLTQFYDKPLSPAITTLPGRDEIKCHLLGRGKHVFVMDAGPGNWSLFFRPLARELSEVARVCLIDRVGYHPEDKMNIARDAKTVARQMKLALAKVRVGDSIILIGHSIGGLNAMKFQSLNPSMVKGMVLLNVPHPRLLESMPSFRTAIENRKKQLRYQYRMALLGLLSLAKGRIPTFGLPESLHNEYYKVVTRPYYYQNCINELMELEKSLLQCREIDPFGDLPLLVLASRQGPGFGDKNDELNPGSKGWLDLQKDLAAMSARSNFLESRGDHFMHLSDTATVASAIISFYRQYFLN